MRNPMATIATSAKAKEVLGWWEIFTEKLMIEGAIAETDVERERNVSLEDWHAETETLRISFLLWLLSCDVPTTV